MNSLESNKEYPKNKDITVILNEVSAQYNVYLELNSYDLLQITKECIQDESLYRDASYPLNITLR